MRLYLKLRELFGRRPASTSNPNTGSPPTRLFVLVEGVNDAHFLRRISAMLHAHQPDLPDLAASERSGDILFVPTGGGDLLPWTYRLASIGLAEFFLLDRETPPVTQARQQLAQIVNLRPRCRAFITAKRSLENYLHSAAIREAIGVTITFGDDDPVAELVTRQVYQQSNSPTQWEDLSMRQRRRRRDRIKKLLNTAAAERMTIERLAERDPPGEVITWLKAIAELCRV